MDELLSTHLRQLKSRAEEVAEAHIAPHAEVVDHDCQWPEHSLRALADAGLMGLHVPARLGGQEQGLLALAVLTETIGRSCSSSGLCYGMHCVGTAVIAAKATHEQEDRYLRPIAQGRHVTTLALSESGTGANFYLSQTQLRREADSYVVNGTKQFVTSGGHADSYVVSTLASTPVQSGEFSCLIVDQETSGTEWLEPWRGLGMRGNSSRGLRLDGARVPLGNMLGEEGDEIWYVFEVITPYFLIAMSGTYLGIAQAALDVTMEHVRNRRFEHSGAALSELTSIQERLGTMWAAVEKSRLMIYRAAQLGDLGDPQALPALLSCKADIADTVVWATNEAMTLCGGTAYRDNNRLTRLLRDARASHVMAPTSAMLRQWTGRALLGLPLL